MSVPRSRILFAMLGMCFSGNTFAETKITFPLIGWEWDSGTRKNVKVPLKSLNASLKAARSAIQFRDSITVGPKDGEAFSKIVEQVAEANETLNREIEFLQDWDPSRYYKPCYLGAVADLIDTIWGLHGSAFGGENGVSAYRYGTYQHMADHFSLDDHRGDNPEEVRAWENYDPRSTDFLMLTDGGPNGDGTELFATRIPKCRR